jgi:hypothetical protein
MTQAKHKKPNRELKYIICRTNEVCDWRHKGCKIGNHRSFHHCHLGSELWLTEVGDHVVLARSVNCITHDGSSRAFRHLVPEASALFSLSVVAGSNVTQRCQYGQRETSFIEIVQT